MIRSIIEGFYFNIRGFIVSLRSPALLFWGLIRVILLIMATVIIAGFILKYRVELSDVIWQKPENSIWQAWLWQIYSWFLSLILMVLAGICAFIVTQLLFSIVIMDYMSQIIEKKITGKVDAPEFSIHKLLLHLIKQEIPRALIPLIISFIIMVAGWFSFFMAPAASFISVLIVSTFLAWDNTDLVPSRRFMSLGERFRLFINNIPFHIGFGLPFLIPIANIIFLSYAPVGGTLYFLEKQEKIQTKGHF